MKRAFDFSAALVGLIVLSPLFFFLAAWIFLSDWGSPFFRHERVGRNGRLFQMLKFRTMVVNADKIGPALTVGEDPRITRVGRFLRKTKLDELPQLWNVVKGDMSLVGPRPEVQEYVSLYTLEQRRVLTVRPGITDPASFEYFDEQRILSQAADPEKYYRSTVMPEKIRINLEYQKRATFSSDLRLILATLARILS